MDKETNCNLNTTYKLFGKVIEHIETSWDVSIRSDVPVHKRNKKMAPCDRWRNSPGISGTFEKYLINQFS